MIKERTDSLRNIIIFYKSIILTYMPHNDSEYDSSTIQSFLLYEQKTIACAIYLFDL